MISSPMQNRKQNDSIGFEPIEHFVGEAPRRHSAKAPIIFRTELGILCQTLNGACGFSQEVLTQAALLFLIPITRLSQIDFCSRSDDNTPLHRALVS